MKDEESRRVSPEHEARYQARVQSAKSILDSALARLVKGTRELIDNDEDGDICGLEGDTLGNLEEAAGMIAGAILKIEQYLEDIKP